MNTHTSLLSASGSSALDANRWWLAVIVGAIILSGPMVLGYAVLDELALAVMLVFALPAWLSASADPMSRLESSHRMLWMLFAAYMILQCVRGAVFLGDIRVARFLVMFVALGAVAWASSRTQHHEGAPLKVARYVCVGSTVYFAAYMLVGVVAEWGPGINRFSLQGWIWSGTSTAVFPVYLALPAIYVLSGSHERIDHRIIFGLCATLFGTAIYYESRSLFLALLILILLGARKLGSRRTIVLVLAYLATILFSPWDDEGLLTYTRVVRDVSQKLFTRDASDQCGEVVRFGNTLVGAIFTIPNICPDKQLDVVSASAIASTIASAIGTAIAPPVKLGQDADRKLAILAAFEFIKKASPVDAMLGHGYYTHRYTLVPVFHEVAERHHYSFPQRYAGIVRTATFTGMIADTGVIGIFLFSALFLFTASGVALRAGSGRILFLGALGLILISLVDSLNYDVVLLYLVLMPRGPLLLMCDPTDRTR